MLHSFVYPLGDLKRELEKRSSFLGSQRVTDETPDMLNRFALTDGESFLSNDMLLEAIDETYSWLKAFGRGTGCGYDIYADSKTHSVSNNRGVKISFNGESRSGLTEFYRIKKQSSVYEDNDNIGCYKIDELVINIQLGEAKSLTYSIVVRYKLGYEKGPFLSKFHTFTKTGVITEDLELSGLSALVIDEEVHKDFGKSHLAVISDVAVALSDIEVDDIEVKRGEYVEYIDYSGAKSYYIADRDFTIGFGSSYYGVALESDLRGKLVIRLDIPDWVDTNMFGKTERDIREAIVDYVLYRWFEYVSQDDASAYFERFEEKAKAAKFALNSERVLLKRKVSGIL